MKKFLSKILTTAAFIAGSASSSVAQGTVVYTSNPVVAHGMKYQGTYSSGTSYSLNDVVLYSGSLFVSLANSNAGNAPATSPSKWQAEVSSPSSMTNNLVAEYDFHESANTGSAASAVIHNISGNAAYDWTLPATNAPTWVKGGVEISTNTCSTTPVLMAGTRSVTIQFQIVPSSTPPNGPTWNYPYILGGTTSDAPNIVLFNNGALYLQDPTYGVILLSQNFISGYHTATFNFPASGAGTMYLDGVLEPMIFGGGNIPVLNSISHWVLGCANGDSQTSSASPIDIYHLAFHSATVSATDASSIANYLSYNQTQVKGVPTTYAKHTDGGFSNRNKLICSGDSTTAGTGGSQSYCGRITLPNFDGQAWTYSAFGEGGAGADGILGLQPTRDYAEVGFGSGMRVQIIWIGINGLSATQYVCPLIRNSKIAGFDPWVMTLYSLSNSSPETTRAAYNANTLQAAKQCGATGVIDLGADPNFGFDGADNGTLSYWTGVDVHMNDTGYTAIAAIVTKTLTAYYLANPLAPTVYNSTGTDAVQDRYVVLDNTSSAFSRTMPDCTDMTGMEYRKHVNTSTHNVTLVPFSAAQPVEGSTTGYVLSAHGNYTFTVMAKPSVSGGGCYWSETSGN